MKLEYTKGVLDHSLNLKYRHEMTLDWLLNHSTIDGVVHNEEINAYEISLGLDLWRNEQSL